MSKPTHQVLAILYVSFFWLTLYSWVETPLEISLKLKKAPIKAFFMPPQKKPFLQEMLQKQLNDFIADMKRDSIRQIDTTKQNILLTGDSMTEGLMFAFQKYAQYNGHQLKTVTWYSSTTLSWSEKDSLRKLIKKYQPTFVIFTTGSNELFIRNIQEREPNIQNIIQQAGNTKMVWIGPPNWAEDTGINQLIEKNIGKDRFFLSKYLKFERARDGAHPTWEAAKIWADTISSWIMHKSKYRIMMRKPPKLPNEVAKR
ncbi:MAG: SGNH/GDSL hydrolase family protein [Microscillaceae bacterium]|nr:SGNH/GDSL hydrolase family protein [Microscillaceae bacterium]MDW8461159.1 SGNH/GDSL hydrolase family protein [Cytophagales bacterium]